jgi:hypothetical protein
MLLLPGTFLHEAGHLILAVFLGVRTGEMKLFPEVGESGSIRLGQVEIAVSDPVRRTLIGLAPVFGGLLLIWVSSYFVTLTSQPFWWLLYGYLLIQVSLTMFSSREDLQGVVVGLGLGLLLLLGVNSLFQLFPSGFFRVPQKQFVSFVETYYPYLQRGLWQSILINFTTLVVLKLFLGLGPKLFRARS